jgi:ribulose-5-phosphate 4-epimerase/fuculose-1-phosphate aldolase
MRLAGRGAFAVASFAPGDLDAPIDCRAHPLTHAAPPPADDLEAHRRIYEWRGDAGGVFSGPTEWAGSLVELDHPMPAVFDEQARHLGARVERLAGASPDRRALRGGANAFAAPGGLVFVLGFNLDRTVFNVELFEKCAKAYLLACAAGGRVGRIPWWVRAVARRRLLRDERRAAASYARGETPAGLKAY